MNKLQKLLKNEKFDDYILNIKIHISYMTQVHFKLCLVMILVLIKYECIDNVIS